jgi:hypothetical protein
VTRSYVRLPGDDQVRRLFYIHGQRPEPMAAAIGCTVGAVRDRLHALGLQPIPLRRPGMSSRLAELEKRIDALEELERRVYALEQRPLTAQVVREDHRRIADGGAGARRARRG